MFEDAAFRALSGGLDAMWQKQQVAGHTLANVETPGYKAKKVQFEQVLRESEEKGSPVTEYKTVVSTDEETEARPDGNNVQVEKEELELWQSYLQYSALTTRMSGRLSTLKYVINNTAK